MHKTPRLLLSDAYTIGSYNSESEKAKEKSIYYLTFRKPVNAVFEDDHRIIFAGLSRLLKKFLAEPITHEEIDETILFLKNRKFTTAGLRDFDFPEEMWRRVVDEFFGYPPITIEAILEGSVVYPHEPVLRVTSNVPGMGPLAAWFESTFLKLWATTERATQARHWLEYNRNLIRSIEREWNEREVNFVASTMMHDFGDRSGSVIEESEELGYVHLYCFPGTDTFCAAYQAWKDGAPDGIGGSVDALAHRIVQGFVEEGSCYDRIYHNCKPGDIVSMVADCYDYYQAVENYILPLAKRSRDEGTNIVVVARPDCYDDQTEILTENGWIYFKDLKSDNLVAQYHNNGSINFTRPLEIIEQNYSGEMIKFKSERTGIDLLVTPNHRMVKKNKKSGEIIIQEASLVTYNDRFTHEKSGRIHNTEDKTLTWEERLWIAFQADGSYSSDQFKTINKINDYNTIRFNFAKQRKADRLIWICENGGFEYSVHREPSRPENYNIYVKVNTLPAKTFDWIDLLNINYQWAREFIEEISYWDATRRTDVRFKYDSTIEENTKTVQTIAALAGCSTTFSVNKDERSEKFNDVYTVHILTDRSGRNTQSINITKETYNGKVYCVKVSTGMILVRRNNQISVSGNSGDALEQILWTVNLAVQHGLYEERNGYKYMTTLRIIEGDGMTFDKMKEINQALIKEGFAPHGTLIFGVGGFLRNNISRDNLSTKFALCAVGNENRPVVKNSNSPGKRTLPLCKVSRSTEDLATGITLHSHGSDKINAMTVYYANGNLILDNFNQVQNRILNEFDTMPKQGGFISLELEQERNMIINKYLGVSSA